MRRALFPGSFDPFTKGHEHIVRKGIALFDEVIIAVGVNTSKLYTFDTEKRLKHIQALFENDPQVKVVSYNSLTIDLCREVGANHIIRGVRDSKDFEYERAIAQMNKDLSGVETILFYTDPEYAAVSSTIIRELFKFNTDISPFISRLDLLV